MSLDRRDPVLVGVAGGALFGATVVHGTAAAAEELLGGSSGSLGSAYGPPGWPLLVYHVALGALGGLLLGWMLRHRLRQEERAMAMERQLLRVQKMEAVARLSAGVNHDVNNLLSALRLRLHLAAGASDDAERRRNLDEAERITQKAAALPQRLLGFARRDAAASSPPRRVVEEALDLLEPALGAIALERALGDAPATALDDAELEQVVVNLVLNARDAVGETGTVRVTLEADGNQVRLRVEDDGHGILEGALERVFDAFYTTKPEGQGTGLGLSTCRMLVEAAGGTIRAATREGGGAAFLVDLPVAPHAPTVPAGADASASITPR